MLVKELWTGLKPRHWRAGRAAHSGTDARARDDGVVRAMEPTRRAPSSQAEAFVVALLKMEKEIAYRELVSRLAEFLYRKEVRVGAWAVDVGLFGSGLFVPEAARELEARNGELWRID